MLGFNILVFLCLSGQVINYENVFEEIYSSQKKHNQENILKDSTNLLYVYIPENLFYTMSCNRIKIVNKLKRKYNITFDKSFNLLEGIGSNMVYGRIWNEDFVINYMYHVNGEKFRDFRGKKCKMYLKFEKKDNNETNVFSDNKHIIKDIDDWSGGVVDETFADIKVLGGLNFIASKILITNNIIDSIQTTIFYEY